MTQTINRPTRVMPSATPTEADIAAWAALPRDEQVRRYQELFQHPIAIHSPPIRPTKFSPRPGNRSPRVAVAEYRLTERARADLIGIYDFTEGKFGSYQADAYYAGLIRSFGLLADFPLIGQTVDDLAAGYRRFWFQADWIEIRAVVHGAQDLRSQLFD